MELFEVGVITAEDTGGLKLKNGNAEAMTKVTEMIIAGEGIGADIGLGAQRLCEKCGHPKFAIVVKEKKFQDTIPAPYKAWGSPMQHLAEEPVTCAPHHS